MSILETENESTSESTCPYLCDDGLLWKWVRREQVVDVTTMPMDDGDYEWLGEEGWVVVDDCHYCC